MYNRDVEKRETVESAFLGTTLFFKCENNLPWILYAVVIVKKL